MNEQEFDKLIEASSLGTPGAQELRARTSASEVADVVRRSSEPLCGWGRVIFPSEPVAPCAEPVAKPHSSPTMKAAIYELLCASHQHALQAIGETLRDR